MTDAEILVRTSLGVVPVEVEHYPNGDPLVRWNSVEYPSAILLRPRSMAGLFAGLFFVDALGERGHWIPPLILPLPPGSRQDRINSSGDYLFTAKSVASAVNARRFPSVTMVDPHSDVIAGLLDRCRVIHPTPDIEPAYLGVIAPDAGAEKRAWRMARALRLPLFRAWKSRDVTTGAISGFGVEPIERGHYLIVDDLCDAGGTFLGLADVLDGLRCTADLYVTHGLFTKGTSGLLDRFRHVFCTDSTLRGKPGVTVFPVCASLLDTTI